MNFLGVKLHNDYAAQFGRLYAKTPKAVFAAVAFSFAMRMAEDNPERALDEFTREWRVLHEQGIVPQKWTGK